MRRIVRNIVKYLQPLVLDEALPIRIVTSVPIARCCLSDSRLRASRDRHEFGIRAIRPVDIAHCQQRVCMSLAHKPVAQYTNADARPGVGRSFVIVSSGHPYTAAGAVTLRRYPTLSATRSSVAMLTSSGVNRSNSTASEPV